MPHTPRRAIREDSLCWTAGWTGRTTIASWSILAICWYAAAAGPPMICGEAIFNIGGAAQQCATDSDGVRDYHGGGGCALSVAYTSSPRLEDFVIFSVNHGCPREPREWSTWIPFTVPANLPAGDATVAWMWIPPSTHAEPEIYFNCATARVQGPGGQLTGGRRLLDHIYAVPGFSTRLPRPIYKNVVPNGALPISTSTGGSSGPSGSTSGSTGGNTGGSSGSTSSPCQSGDSRCTTDPLTWWEQWRTA